MSDPNTPPRYLDFHGGPAAIRCKYCGMIGTLLDGRATQAEVDAWADRFDAWHATCRLRYPQLPLQGWHSDQHPSTTLTENNTLTKPPG